MLLLDLLIYLFDFKLRLKIHFESTLTHNQKNCISVYCISSLELTLRLKRLVRIESLLESAGMQALSVLFDQLSCPCASFSNMQSCLMAYHGSVCKESLSLCVCLFHVKLLKTAHIAFCRSVWCSQSTFHTHSPDGVLKCG